MKTLLTIIALQDLFSCLGVLKRSLYMKQVWFSRYMVVYFIKMNQKFQMVEPHFPLFWYPMFHSALEGGDDSVTKVIFNLPMAALNARG